MNGTSDEVLYVYIFGQVDRLKETLKNIFRQYLEAAPSTQALKPLDRELVEVGFLCTLVFPEYQKE